MSIWARKMKWKRDPSVFGGSLGRGIDEPFGTEDFSSPNLQVIFGRDLAFQVAQVFSGIQNPFDFIGVFQRYAGIALLRA